MKTTITAALLTRYVAGDCTPDEEQLVAEWYDSFEERAPYFENEYSDAAIHLKAETKEKISAGIGRSSLIKRMITYGSVAAAVLILLLGVYEVFSGREGIKRNLVEKERASIDSINIIPGANKAMLTLADGTVIDLNNAANGTLAKEAGTKVSKQADGRLEYRHIHSPLTANHSPAYNILSTPKGGQYQITLPDGSNVWLNAASSIRFPTAFTGNERNVEITGEVYFEVAHDSRKPFIVHVPGESHIEVLGTHFNVNAYGDERMVKTTLLQGSVKVVNRESAIGNEQKAKDKKQSVILKPGEQVSISPSSQLSQPIPVQTDEVIAWKNGLFQFNNVTIETVMKQVARWYDVQVVYERDVSQDLFRGKIYRNADISQLLKILELSGVHFKIEGKKIIVQ